MERLEPILLQSIEQYQKIVYCLKKMDVEIGTASPDELQELHDSFTKLQAQVQETDKVLLPQLTLHPADTESMQSLIDKRERVLQEILHLNKHIGNKASGVQSLIAHELKKLRNGISAMSGYRQRHNNQGRIINKTS